MQVALNFDKITPNGLLPIVKKFQRWKLEVADVQATNKPKRESGMQIKTAVFIFKTGQKLEVKVKNTGTVFQIKLNGKALPIKHVDDMDKAIIEIVDYVQANEKAYLAAQGRRTAKLVAGETKPVVRTTRAEQIDKYAANVEDLSGENENLKKTVSASTSELDAIRAKLSALMNELEELVNIGEQLQSELETLKEAA